MLLLGVACSPLMKGNLHMDFKNYEAAIASYRQAIESDPDDWRARQKLGMAYLKTDRPQQAAAEFTRALEANPRDPVSTYHLAEAFLQMGQRREAIETLRQYRNPQHPDLEEAIRKQVTLMEFSDTIQEARRALAEERSLKPIETRQGTVAVFYFRDSTPDNSLRHFQKALATLIMTDLAKVSALQVLERLQVHFLLAEMQLGQTGIIDAANAPRMGRLLGAENLVVGVISSGSLNVQASIASTSHQNIIGSVSAQSKLEEFYKLEKEIVYQLLKVLNVPYTPQEEKLFSQYHTKELQAVVYFGQGLEAFDAGQWTEAAQFFRKAQETDPDFELARLYRRACPGGDAPGVSALGQMTALDALTALNAAVAAAGAAGALGGAMGGGPDDSGSPAANDSTGGISVDW
jgi:tetratricopeptide (TPR) repeat protein